MKYRFLTEINQPSDIKKLTIEQLKVLAEEIRYFLLHSVAKTGGHLSSNLGTVELTLALHYVFDSPNDPIVWDVGHQAYTHKILTGRRDRFDTLRQADGLSGFLKRSESKHDVFGAGHASTSLSAAVGFAYANQRLGRESTTVAVIGDGALTGGMAYEALNLIGDLGQRMLIVVNDNEMSIAKNVGALNRSLTNLRTYRGYTGLKRNLKKITSRGALEHMASFKTSIRHMFLPTSLFESLGARYYGPVDGHNLDELIPLLRRLKAFNGPMVLHTVTVKGKGYTQAEVEPEFYHGVGSFEIEQGMSNHAKEDYSAFFGKTLLAMAKDDPRITAISAAMPGGTGLAEFAEKLPEQFLDVGIAEENAVTMAAALALQGLKPYVTIYSTFLQRAFDQLIHDVALQQANVVFCIDRSGLVGADGETHQGVFDTGYLSLVPGLHVFSPKDRYEFKRILELSRHFSGPMAIKYPRDAAIDINQDDSDLYLPERIGQGSKILLVGYGRMVRILDQVKQRLPFEVDLLNHRMVLPIRHDVLDEIFAEYDQIYVYEESVYYGSLAEKLKAVYPEIEVKTLPMTFIKQGLIPDILEAYGLGPNAIVHDLMKRHG